MGISKKSWAGVAVEATPGTLAAAPTLYIPCKSILKGTRKMEYLNEERGTRDGNYGVVPTTRQGTWDPQGPWYNDTWPYLLIGALGHDAVTQPDATHAPTVYKHTLSLADVPPAMSVFKGYDTATYTASYSCVQKLTLKWSTEKLLEASASLECLFPVKWTGSAFTPSFSTTLPFAGYAPTITLNGSGSSDIDEVNFEFDQKLTLFYPSAGSPDFVKVYFGERTAKVDFTARFDTTTEYDAWVANTLGSFVFDVQGTLIVNSGGSGTPPNTNYFEELSLTLATINLDSVEHDLSKDNVLIKVKATAIVQGGTLISGFVQNTIASYAT